MLLSMIAQTAANDEEESKLINFVLVERLITCSIIIIIIIIIIMHTYVQLTIHSYSRRLHT